MTVLHRLSLLAAFLFVSGCALVGPDGGSGEVNVRVLDAERLLALNGTDADIYYFAVGEQASTRIDWLPMISEENRIAAGRQRKVAYFVDEDERVVLFYWWRAVEALCSEVPEDGSAAGTCLRPGGVQTMAMRR